MVKNFFPLFADLPLQFEPGEGNAYSNAGYVVLGAIVEAAAEMPYEDYLAQHVFDPAGMTRSGFPVRDGRDADLAIGYTGSEPSALVPNLGMLPISGCPAGSSSHTAEDLLKLERALRGGKLLDPTWTSWIYGRDPESGETAVQAAIGIAGGGEGVSAYLIGEASTTVVVLSNRDPSTTGGMVRQLSRALKASKPASG